MSDATVPAAKPAPPTIPELQAQIASAREDLVASIATLKAETTPGAMVRRGGRSIRGLFTDEFGGVRPERVGIVGAVVVGVIALGVLRRLRRA
jgi:hypothetical protein